MSGHRFDNWPENLPRADLIRLLRDYAGQAHLVEQVLARALGYPLGDGEDHPADLRVVGDEDAPALAGKAERRIAMLTRRARRARDPRVFLEGDEVAAGVRVVNMHGEVIWPAHQPWRTTTPVVEVLVPTEFRATVAEARARRAAMDELVAQGEELRLYDEGRTE